MYFSLIVLEIKIHLYLLNLWKLNSVFCLFFWRLQTAPSMPFLRNNLQNLLKLFFMSFPLILANITSKSKFVNTIIPHKKNQNNTRQCLLWGLAVNMYSANLLKRRNWRRESLWRHLKGLPGVFICGCYFVIKMCLVRLRLSWVHSWAILRPLILKR